MEGHILVHASLSVPYEVYMVFLQRLWDSNAITVSNCTTKERSGDGYKQCRGKTVQTGAVLGAVLIKSSNIIWKAVAWCTLPPREVKSWRGAIVLARGVTEVLMKRAKVGCRWLRAEGTVYGPEVITTVLTLLLRKRPVCLPWQQGYDTGMWLHTFTSLLHPPPAVRSALSEYIKTIWLTTMKSLGTVYSKSCAQCLSFHTGNVDGKTVPPVILLRKETPMDLHRAAFKMENSPYLPNPLASPALMVLASTAEASRDASIPCQQPRPFGVPVSADKDVHIPFTNGSYTFASMYHRQGGVPGAFANRDFPPSLLHLHPQFAPPNLDCTPISMLNHSGVGAFRPFASTEDRESYQSAFTPAKRLKNCHDTDSPHLRFSDADGKEYEFGTQLPSSSPGSLKVDDTGKKIFAVSGLISDRETSSSPEDRSDRSNGFVPWAQTLVNSRIFLATEHPLQDTNPKLLHGSHRARCRVTGAGHKHPAPRCRRGSPGGEEEQRQLQPALTTRPEVEGGSGCFSFPVSPRFFKTLGCTVEQSTGDVPDVLLTLKFLRNYRDSLH
ncbi:RING finger protein 220 [Anas platyrhynchos]|uniref:RING finger protein 220 n=1 Tax=Anas platyrhynchos TaxID=8839 RepID=R0JD72_ANAPL|nr:RING finger protein 220 [Anas platyrhynchos]